MAWLPDDLEPIAWAVSGRFQGKLTAPSAILRSTTYGSHRTCGERLATVGSYCAAARTSSFVLASSYPYLKNPYPSGNLTWVCLCAILGWRYPHGVYGHNAHDSMR
jgi:hypothetical protein